VEVKLPNKIHLLRYKAEFCRKSSNRIRSYWKN